MGGLSQDSNEMFERNLGHIARGAREVSLWVDGLDEPRTGFLAGLDEQFIQLCLTDTQTLSTIDREFLTMIEETGNTLGTYARDNILDVPTVSRIREKISHFQSVAQKVYPRQSKDVGENEPSLD